jgi:hypothetical protein
VVGGLTLNVGLVLVVMVVIAAASETWRQRRLLLRPLAAAVCSSAGFVGWLAYSWEREGSPFAFVHAESYWGGAHFVWFTAPFTSFGRLLSSSTDWRRNPSDVLAAATLLFAVAGFYCLVRCWRDGFTLPTAWLVYLIGSLAIGFTDYWMSSSLRLMLVVIPVFVLLGRRLSDRWTVVTVGVMGMSQGLLALIVFVSLTPGVRALLSP